MRTRLAALALALAGLAALGQGIADLAFAYPSDPEARLAELRAAPGRALTVGALFLVSQLLLLPGVLAIAARIRGRGAALATVAASILVLGIFGHAVVGGANLARVDMADPARDPAEMVALYAATDENPVYLPFTALGLLGFLLGTLLLAGAMWRSAQWPRWVPVTLALALVVEFGAGALPYGSLAGLALFAVALGGAAWGLVRGGELQDAPPASRP